MQLNYINFAQIKFICHIDSGGARICGGHGGESKQNCQKWLIFAISPLMGREVGEEPPTQG